VFFFEKPHSSHNTTIILRPRPNSSRASHPQHNKTNIRRGRHCLAPEAFAQTQHVPTPRSRRSAPQSHYAMRPVPLFRQSERETTKRQRPRSRSQRIGSDPCHQPLARRTPSVCKRSGNPMRCDSVRCGAVRCDERSVGPRAVRSVPVIRSLYAYGVPGAGCFSLAAGTIISCS